MSKPVKNNKSNKTRPTMAKLPKGSDAKLQGLRPVLPAMTAWPPKRVILFAFVGPSAQERRGFFTDKKPLAIQKVLPGAR